MAHFTVTIAENIKAGIFKESIRKKILLALAFRKKISVQKPSLTGYMAVVNELTGRHEYMMVKTTDGSWALLEAQPGLNEKIGGKWQPVQDNEITLAVKKAISDHENKQ